MSIHIINNSITAHHHEQIDVGLIKQSHELMKRNFQYLIFIILLKMYNLEALEMRGGNIFFFIEHGTA